MKYWLITMGFRYHNVERWNYQTIVIDKHPGDYLADANSKSVAYENYLVFAMEISEEKYNDFKKVML